MHMTEELQRQIALLAVTDPSTPPHLLAQILDTYRNDTQIEQALASNPNTQIADLSTLILSYPEAVLRNPVLPLISLEDPAFVSRLRDTHLNHFYEMLDKLPKLAYKLLGEPGLVYTFDAMHKEMRSAGDPRAEVLFVQWPTKVEIYQSGISALYRPPNRVTFRGVGAMLSTLYHALANNRWAEEQDYPRISTLSDLEELADNN